MSKRRRTKRRFYPEFYTDEELKRHESESKKNEQSSFIENEDEKAEVPSETMEIIEIIDEDATLDVDTYEQPNVIVYNGYQPQEIQDISDINETIPPEDEYKIEEAVEEIAENTDKSSFIQNIFERTYESANPIVYQNYNAETEAEADIDTGANESKNFNTLIYPKKSDTNAVYKQIDNMEKDYLQQKIDILNSSQNINKIIDNEDSISIEIEIPQDMYIKEIPIEQYTDYSSNHNHNFDENDAENPPNLEYSEKIETEQSMPVFAPMPAVPEPYVSVPENENKKYTEEIPPIIEHEPEHEHEPEIKIEETPEIYANPKIIPFDREKAIEYAHRWALDRNPAYYNFEELGGDCTNYISQILLAGGCKMDTSSLIYGWYYNHANDKSHSWTGVEQLYNYLVREKEHGITAKEIDLSEVEAGDIVQLSFNGKTFQHTPFIVSVKRTSSGEVAFDRIKICAHSFDSENRTLDTYQWKKIRFIRILGYRDKA